jgi:hypothetical protein
MAGAGRKGLRLIAGGKSRALEWRPVPVFQSPISRDGGGGHHPIHPNRQC